jgi:glutathione-regulated potassium-efflux system protein KefB
MDFGLLETILIMLLASVVAVPLFNRFGLGAVLGYLAAGLIVGPSALNLVTQPENILAVSEFGVVMLLFIIGLELSPQRLWVMRRSVFGGGSIQVILSTIGFAVIFRLFEFSWTQALIIGGGLALSSTALALRLLADRKELNHEYGRLSFAILLFQDLAAIPLLTAISLLSAKGDSSTPMWQSALNVVVVVLAVIFGGRYLLRPVFRAVASTGLVEVFTATALLIVAAVSWGMHAVGLSMALGGFLAGVLLAESEFRHELESHIEPFKGLLLGFFFMAVGMSLDLGLLVREPLFVLVGIAALMLVKAIALAIAGKWLENFSWRNNLRLVAVLSMGGEFGFVIFAQALGGGLIEQLWHDRLVLIVGLSMALTPVIILALDRWLRAHPETQEQRPFDVIENEYPRVIIAGFGRMGQIVGRVLRAQKIPFTALENSAQQVDDSRRFGNKIYFGDPARPELLRAAHVDKAEVFVLTTDDPEANIRTARLVKKAFPHLKIFARARNRQHAWRLMDLDVDSITRETLHSSLKMTEEVLCALGISPEQAQDKVQRFAHIDEQALREQYLFYDDEAALIASAEQMFKDLDKVFEDDEQVSSHKDKEGKTNA